MRVTFPLMPAAYTSTASGQVLGFRDIGLLTHRDRLVCGSCSSGQRFAFGFLQIPPRDGHPCRSANRSPCRADSGLAPPSHPATTTCAGTAPVKALRAMPGAPKKRRQGCPCRLINEGSGRERVKYAFPSLVESYSLSTPKAPTMRPMELNSE